MLATLGSDILGEHEIPADSCHLWLPESLIDIIALALTEIVSDIQQCSDVTEFKSGKARTEVAIYI